MTPLPDPEQPTGPPPAFSANVLEAEAARRRRPDPEDTLRPEADMAGKANVPLPEGWDFARSLTEGPQIDKLS